MPFVISDSHAVYNNGEWLEWDIDPAMNPTVAELVEWAHKNNIELESLVLGATSCPNYDVSITISMDVRQ